MSHQPVIPFQNITESSQCTISYSGCVVEHNKQRLPPRAREGMYLITMNKNSGQAPAQPICNQVMTKDHSI
eukprot:8569386-Karenia_brevis.AAC.1